VSCVDDAGPKIYRFGPFEIDLRRRVLLRAGKAVPLTPKVFDTLAVLVARPGRVMERAELLKLVWRETFVEENNLTQNISALRKVLGEKEYIATVPRRGYRFTTDVEAVAAPGRFRRG
jgi:DNA-binding winged helix-turn-helix (wHTH) protein